MVIPRLKKAQSVVDVTNFGGLTTQFMLELDPARLLQYGLTLSQVIDAINANNASGGGSVIDRGEVSYVVRGVGLLRSLDDMGNVVVIDSVVAGVGTSTLAALLARELSERGLKCVLVDADLRDGALTKSLNVADHVGLSDLLRGA